MIDVLARLLHGEEVANTVTSDSTHAALNITQLFSRHKAKLKPMLAAL